MLWFFLRVMRTISVTLGHMTIESVHTYRYLGVIIGDQLNWCNHIEYIYNKLMKHVGIFLQDSRKTSCCHIKTD